jgi:two-component system nitrate/nitrite response regulator NarL
MTKIAVVDRYRLFAEALGAMLSQHGYQVVALALSGADAIAMSRAEEPDVFLVNRRLPDADGLDVVSGILQVRPTARVIVLTADADPSGAADALARGARGFVHESRGVAALTESIHRVLRDEVAVNAVATPGPVHGGAGVTDAQRLSRYLTGRERECLEMLVAGLSTKAMAYRLGVETTTIRSHVQAVLHKLGAHSRLEAAAFATQHGLAPRTAVPRASWGDAM